MKTWNVWRRLRRQIGIGLIFAVVAGGLWYYQESEYRERLSWQGVPEWDVLTPLSWHRVLRNDGFLVGWSDVRVNPLWVSYLLRDVDSGRIDERPDFRRDWRSVWPVAATSYRGSGYDRGHLAPNYAMATVHGRHAQQDSFLMSNISPQRPALNRQLWQRLEEVVIDHFVPRFGRLQVITGPIFHDDFSQGVFHRVGLVEVPEAFYKILVVPGDAPRALAFLMPQDVQGDEPLDRFLVSIDEIEARTGLDFMPELEAGRQRQLESRIRTEGWNLEPLASLPGRYE
ncbi:DNA/RNA non-specific endonuclease [Aidingimonas lacisalsi]|uniref:DNA/RNA non-specific endonuclease n=1 Tax=Aidingimonas lacisalsi TaxID=2604086 RepID=UPI0011D2C429|nr:DNA/RNA non-specific endonuclease [Aidingimonas lacisalsi]